MPNAFYDTKRVTKSYTLATNTLARIKVPKRQLGDGMTNESSTRLKRGRLVGSKDRVWLSLGYKHIQYVYAYIVYCI